MNWEEVRVNAAIAAMQGILVNASYATPNRESMIAQIAIDQADALVKKLRSHSAPTTDKH